MRPIQVDSTLKKRAKAKVLFVDKRRNSCLVSRRREILARPDPAPPSLYSHIAIAYMMANKVKHLLNWP